MPLLAYHGPDLSTLMCVDLFRSRAFSSVGSRPGKAVLPAAALEQMISASSHAKVLFECADVTFNCWDSSTPEQSDLLHLTN